MTRQTLWTLGLAAAGAVGVASGQSQPAASSPMEELLAEVRGLRAELRQTADASIRAQLLVARLQLQEQRILTAGRQLTEVQDKLAASEGAMAPLAHQFKKLAEEVPPLPEQREDMEGIKGMLKAQLDQHQKATQELRAREASLQRVLADEQARWTDFNDRLDELERALPARRPR
jgi:chromosome segregation ATPase